MDMPPVAALLFLVAALQLSGGVRAWSQHDRVLLREIQAITLYSDRYTNGRRSAPIPQLKCVGGSAGCSAMIPTVVQCHNRGWDGIDVQWECKVDMDNAYRFGKVEVSCEGFDYPDDPYVLRGSCGLEYTLELTEEGRKRSQSGHSFGGFGSGYSSKSWNIPSTSFDGSGLVGLVVIAALAFLVYKLFLSGPSVQDQQPPPDYDRHDYQNYRHASAPPPPGFKSEYTGSGSTSGFGGFGNTAGFGSGATQGPGFWTGVGTGGLLGYLFGNRRSQSHYTAYPPYHNTWSGPPYHNTWSGPSSSGSTFSSSSSSGVRTASGFGQTKRR